MAPAFPMGELADVRSAQGLLLMPPSMFTLAGELTPAVLHVVHPGRGYRRTVHRREPLGRDGRANPARDIDPGMQPGMSGAESHPAFRGDQAASPPSFGVHGCPPSRSGTDPDCPTRRPPGFTVLRDQGLA